MADLTWGWKYNFVEIFDSTLLIPRDKVEKLADDSNGTRCAEWDIARLVLLPKNGDLSCVSTGVESVHSTLPQRYSRRCV
jgi:hypothetical protein